MNREEAYSAERITSIHARLDPEAQGLIEYFLRKIAALEERAMASEKRQRALEGRISELEGRLAKTSRNSHRPSGSEPFLKGRSPLERPQGLASGGQKDMKGIAWSRWPFPIIG